MLFPITGNFKGNTFTKEKPETALETTLDENKTMRYTAVMIQKLLFAIIAAIIGLWVATEFIPNVAFTGSLQTLALAGALLGIANTVAKPVLNVITLPLRILTLGLSSFLISMLMVWIVDILFPELIILGFIPLFWTTLVVWGANMLLYPLGRRP